jgi:tetratricopeptide (TPR) repeat protein
MIAGTALAQQIRIDGRIKTEDGHMPESMRVILLDDMYQQKSVAYADAGGRFVFQAAGRVNYYVQIDAAGTDYEPQTIRVETGQNPYGSGREVINLSVLLKIKEVIKRQHVGLPPAPAGVAFAQPVPQSAREAYDKASKSLAKDDSAGAVASFKHALEVFPDYFDALESLGSEYVKQRVYDEAIPLLRHAVQINDRGWRSHYALGVALVESQQRTEGMSELRRSIELNPESPNGHMRLGMELAKDPQAQTEAIKELEKVPVLAGKSIPDVYFYLASLYSKQKQYKEAADALEAYLAAQSKVDDAQRAQYKKAIQQLREKAAKPLQD